jgi:hypothetical protein
MPHGIPESDWKVFRELREVALERFCDRALQESRSLISDSTNTHYERFRALFGLVGERNRDIARGFDGPKRSAMLVQLSVIHSLGLLEPTDLARFSDETRETIESLASLRR